ncbi:MAG TPA: magnesium transporter [Acidimicrobiales bacterium]
MVPRRAHPVGRRIRARLGPGAAVAGQGLVALGLNSTTSFAAGGILGSITSSFERYPGLLVLVPAAIGLRGNIFGSFGNRISTAIHTGTFRLTTRRDSVLGQNVLAAIVLTAAMSLILALVAAVVCTAFDLGQGVRLLDLATISIAGGMLASTLVLTAALGLAAGAVRFGWDLDTVNAPLVSTLGDVLTLPALWLATYLLGIPVVTGLVASLLIVGAAATLVAGARSRLDQLRRIVRESLPVLAVAGTVSATAGVVLERRLDAFAALPALLVLVPAHLSSAGALGGILSGRLASKLALGLTRPARFPDHAARRDIALVAALALPVYAFNALGAQVTASLLGQSGPGLAKMVAVSVLGGSIAVAFVVAVAYYGSLAADRLGVDPDSYGIPLVSSSVDLVGAFTLVAAMAVLGLT